MLVFSIFRTEKDVEAATTVLTDAFKDDTFTNFLINGHKSLLADLQRAQVKAALIGGEVYVAETEADGIIGVAVWFGPGTELLGSEGQAEAGFNQFMADLGSKDPDMPAWWMGYFMPTYDVFMSERLGDPKYKYTGWHLQLFGVLLHYRRRGVGTALIRRTEEEGRKNPGTKSKHLTVKTETEGACAFYKSVGFVEKGETVIESEKKLNDTVPMWCFAKELL
ncbi:hypothetical protein DFH11DRAFT_1732688 [Phellopilus nigrolimitatus]|nr:hypothetical protein DFH11DRAFT_1732688 [Phellopilus nigrolimitatus]